MSPRPVNVAASRSRGVLILDWEGGHHSEYPLAGLRSACPCAGCRGGHENMGVQVSPDMLHLPEDLGPAHQLEALEPVGTYAVQLMWKDGHSDGLYTWNYLWALCPCGGHAGAGEGRA
jgi:DUF971 family protein